MRYWQVYGQQVAYDDESLKWTFDEALTLTNFQDYFIFQHLYAQDYNTLSFGSNLSQSFRAIGSPA
ncbi:hypothetical protein IT6_06965 [Methylacidiphilum caldifontis]|uniref:hypothetical protein n=1 Tax=Methylacidiphilum caldifontis TaxID=2795386 RepID=UPI001A8CC1E5|nr:hypothetical protein [Methylacidiphilum caldifontis]QSR88124.1 hypothetical protein IT6_06965 [Methylacidiphilum caldifontis]